MDSNFYDAEAMLVDKIATNLYDNLPDLFTLRTKRWRHPCMHCEGYTIGLFDDLIQKISSESAFNIVPIALNIVLEQKEDDLFCTALSLLSELMRASQTTEIPKILIQHKNRLNEMVNTRSTNAWTKMYWNSIKEWYRLI